MFLDTSWAHVLPRRQQVASLRSHRISVIASMVYKLLNLNPSTTYHPFQSNSSRFYRAQASNPDPLHIPIPQTTHTKPIITGDLNSLPPARFRLRIISLSYNRSDVHTLMNPNLSNHRVIRYKDPQGHFSLSAIPEESVKTFTQPVLTDKIRTLKSCFSSIDQELWKSKRQMKKEMDSSIKPTHELRLTFNLKIKETHKSAVIRKTLRKRWIAALKLVIQYGCYSISRNDTNSSSSSNQLLNHSNQTTPTTDSADGFGFDPQEAQVERWWLEGASGSPIYFFPPTLGLCQTFSTKSRRDPSKRRM